ncbi:hypothetical protein C8R43DRAFT_1117848 [Mycena crocata]|nr:hypothetical protein C8R43DRAFT_1117848 [Mycena crocata]
MSEIRRDLQDRAEYLGRTSGDVESVEVRRSNLELTALCLQIERVQNMSMPNRYSFDVRFERARRVYFDFLSLPDSLHIIRFPPGIQCGLISKPSPRFRDLRRVKDEFHGGELCAGVVPSDDLPTLGDMSSAFSNTYVVYIAAALMAAASSHTSAAYVFTREAVIASSTSVAQDYHQLAAYSHSRAAQLYTGAAQLYTNQVGGAYAAARAHTAAANAYMGTVHALAKAANADFMDVDLA